MAKSEKKQRASIQDVARRAGVSPMTVSNVLRDRADQMGEETRQRVTLAIRELNYVPVRTAVQNRHVETRTIGVLFIQDLHGVVGQRTFDGMCTRARELDYDITLFLRSQPNWMGSGVDLRFLDRRCDGFILVAAEEPEITELLISHEIPVVQCYVAEGSAGVPFILPDNEHAMRLTTEYMIARGHTRIAHLAGPRTNSEAKLRRDAFHAVMREHGLTECADWIIQDDTWGESGLIPGCPGRLMAAEALDLKPTAVVCANDGLALDLWAEAESRGLKVPDDVSITGMDGVPQAVQAGLTTIAIPFERIGRASVEALALLVSDRNAIQERTIVPVELLIGKSVRQV